MPFSWAKLSDLFLCSLGIFGQSSSGLVLFVTEAAQKSHFFLCVDAATRHQGERSFDIRKLIGPRVLNSFHRMLQLQKWRE